MVVQNEKNVNFIVTKNVAKLDFLNKEIWHTFDYKKMLIFQVFYNFNDIVFEVEVSRRQRMLSNILPTDNLLINYQLALEVIKVSYFPTNEEEISLIKFIAKYQYLNVSDAKYFFNSSRYYRNRIKNLIDKNFLRRIRWMLVLGKSGIQYVKF